MNFRVRFRLACLVAGALLEICLTPRIGTAQFRPFLVPRESDSAFRDGQSEVRLPRNRLAQDAYEKALSTLDDEQNSQSLETLQRLLDQESDVFQFHESGLGPSLLTEISRQLRAHHEDYQRLFGSAAQELLDRAHEQNQTFLLEDVVRRFGMTDAGYQAMQELARVQQDRGDPGAAARTLELQSAHPNEKRPRDLLIAAASLLAESGLPDAARSLLDRHAELIAKDTRDNLDSQFQQLQAIVPPASEAQLFEWRVPFGGIHHGGQTSAAPARFDDAWRGGLIHDVYDFPQLMLAPQVAEQLAQNTRDLTLAMQKRLWANTNLITFPAARPLIVNGLAITAAPGSIKAFDLSTGRLEWNGAIIDETFEDLEARSYSPDQAHDVVREEMRELFAAVRGWRDLTAASLSTDGEQVYAISDVQLVGTTSPQRLMQNTQWHPLLPQRSNRLTAYDLASDGQLRWSIGRPSQEGALATGEPAREIFFYGAPLPVDDHLYVIGEERGQVQLFEIDPATGAILWSVALLNPELDLILDDMRRLAGLMPAYGGGLLICPTGEGSLVAVDPVRRRVVWTHFYADGFQRYRSQVLLRRNLRSQSQSASQSLVELLNDDRWFDSRVIVHDDKVIFTPPDDDELVCVRLSDGRPVWEQPLPRSQRIVVATVYHDQIVFLGRNEISAISLNDAQPVWPAPIPVPAPSGRGVRMGHQYLQPLQTGEIAVIHLDSGRLMTRLPLASGDPAGNLVAANGTLVTQTATEVRGFQSRDWLEEKIATLREDNDVSRGQSLALQGEWALQQGQLQDGLKDLKAALALDGSSYSTRRMLDWAQLEGLRTDFTAFRSEADDLERSLTSPEQRLQFLRIYAAGLQSAGEFEEALKRYLAILSLVPFPDPIRNIDGSWSVSNSRWVIGKLQDLLTSAAPPRREKLLSLFNDWLAQAEPLLWYYVVPACPAEWLDEKLVLKRLHEIPVHDAFRHQREALLRRELESAQPEYRMQAAAELLRLAFQSNDVITAKRLSRQLEAEPRPLLLDADQTTAELAAEMRSNPENAKVLATEITWSEELKVDESHQHVPTRSQLFQIPILGSRDGPLAGWTFFVDPSGANIEIFDPHGRHRSRIPTGLPGSRFATESSLTRYVCLHNHLAMIVMLDRMIVLNFLSDAQSPQLLLNRQFFTEEDSLAGNRIFHSSEQRPGLRTAIYDFMMGPGGNAGSLTDAGIFFSAGTDLIAIDTAGGVERLLWRRRALPPGCEILADDKFVVAHDLEGKTLTVFRAVDGAFVRKIPVPAGALTWRQREHGDWGRLIPVLDESQGQFQWSLYDPAIDEAAWSHKAPAGTCWAPVTGQDVAFLSPDHVLTIHDGLTGKERFKKTLDLDTAISRVRVLEFPDQWILLTTVHAPEPVPRAVLSDRVHEQGLLDVNGPVVAIDKTTRSIAWKTEVSDKRVVTQTPIFWPLLLLMGDRVNSETLILNRDTGEVIRRHAARDDGSGVSWSTETDPLRLSLRFGMDSVVLEEPGIQDEPRPSPEPPPAQNEK